MVRGRRVVGDREPSNPSLWKVAAARRVVWILGIELTGFGTVALRADRSDCVS
jgi:hypothetical protein